MKYMGRTAGYTWTDYKTNTQITKELKITPFLDKLLEYKRKWIQHVNRMSRNRLPTVMKHYSPTGRRNHGRLLKRLLDTWDRNGSTRGPTPWQIYDDIYIYIHTYIYTYIYIHTHIDGEELHECKIHNSKNWYLFVVLTPTMLSQYEPKIWTLLTERLGVFTILPAVKEWLSTYEGWNFNSGNYFFTNDTK